MLSCPVPSTSTNARPKRARSDVAGPCAARLLDSLFGGLPFAHRRHGNVKQKWKPIRASRSPLLFVSGRREARDFTPPPPQSCLITIHREGCKGRREQSTHHIDRSIGGMRESETADGI